MVSGCFDIGCRGGSFLRVAKRLGAIAQGIEPREYAARVAQSQGLDVWDDRGKLLNGRGLKSSRQNHVVEHVPDPVETLRAIRRLLAPREVIWIAVPNAASPICRALEGRWYSCDLPYHLMQFTPASVARAGRGVGLSVRFSERN